MNMAMLGGFMGGLGDTYHEQNLMQMQQEMERRKLISQEMFRQGQRPEVLPEASTIFMQAGMDALDPKKKLEKVAGDAFAGAAHVHVKAGSSSYPQQSQQIPLQYRPIPSQLPEPGAPPEAGGATGAPGAAAAPEAAGAPGAPTPPPGIEATPPSPEAMRTPLPSSISGMMPTPPPLGQSDIVRSGYRSPQEMAQLEASAAGLKAKAMAEGQMPAKVAEAEALANARYHQKMMESEAAMAKAGYRWKRDPMGEFTSEVEQIPKGNLSVQAQANVEKTGAQTEAQQATAGLRRAQTESEPLKRDLVSETILYRRAQTNLAKANADPNSPINQYHRAQIANLQSLVNDRLTANDPAAMDQLVEIVRANPDVMHEFPAKDRTKIAMALQARGYAVPAKIPGAQQTQETAAHQALSTISTIRDIVQRYPDVVGPVMGRVGLTEQEWGSPAYTAADDPEKAAAEQQLRTQMTYLLAQESKAVMGGRVPQQWLQEMKKASPNPTQAMSFLQGSLQGVETNANNVIGEANNVRYGRGTTGAPKPPPGTSGKTEHKVGDTVMYNGKQHRITKINPNGTADLEPVK